MSRLSIDMPLWRRALVLAAGLLLCWAGDSRSAPDDPRAALPADLDLVPRDAAGFIHFRAAELWQSEWLTDLRFMVGRAGPEAWKAFVKKCAPDPSIIERITLVMLTPQTFDNPFPNQVDPEGHSVLVVVSTSKPYDRLQLMQALGMREKVYRRSLYHFNEDLWSGLVLIDDRTFLIGAEDSLVQFFDMTRQKNTDGPLQGALRQAAQKNHLVLGLNAQLFAKQPNLQGFPAPLLPLLDAQCATITLNLDQQARLDVRLDFTKENQATEGEKAVRAALEMSRQGLAQPIAELEKNLKLNPDKVEIGKLPENFAALIGLGVLREIDTLLEKAPVERNGTVVQMPLTYKKQESAAGLLVPMFGFAAIERSGRFIGGRFGIEKRDDGKNPHEEQLRQVAAGLDRYHQEKGSYPPPATYDKDGRPLLSWRVALLPYLGQDTLYKQFRLDEPWDSLHNKRLIKQMPQIFQSQERSWGKNWRTTVQVFTGERTLFEGKTGARKTDVPGKTILLTLTGEAEPYWTKPADLPFTATKLPNLFGQYGDTCHVLFADGTYRALTKQTDTQVIREMIKKNGDKNKLPKE